MSRQKSKAPLPTGKQIKKTLIDLDMRQYDLAQALGVSTIYIRYIANDQRAATELRKRIAGYLASEMRRSGYPLPIWARESINNNNNQGVRK